MAVCWLICILLAIGMLLFTESGADSDLNKIALETSFTYIISRMKLQVQSSLDLHEVFVAIISGIFQKLCTFSCIPIIFAIMLTSVHMLASGSYNIYTLCLWECVLLSLLYEFHPMIVGIHYSPTYQNTNTVWIRCVLQV